MKYYKNEQLYSRERLNRLTDAQLKEQGFIFINDLEPEHNSFIEYPKVVGVDLKNKRVVYEITPRTELSKQQFIERHRKRLYLWCRDNGVDESLFKDRIESVTNEIEFVSLEYEIVIAGQKEN